MNNRYIMYFSVYSLYLLWLLEGHLFFVALCSYLPQNVNDPDSASTFPHSPQTSKSKERGKDVVLVCMFACYQSLWASVHLLRSLSRYHRQPCLDRVTSSHSFSCGCGPWGRLQLATGPVPRAPLSPSAYFQLKTQGALQAHCEWANSLSSKGAKRMFINYLDPC